MKRFLPALGAGLATMVVSFIVLSGLAVLDSGVARAASGTASSAVTKSGAGRFSALSVTVDQSANLIDQVVHISWTGGTPTTPTNGNFNTDFLQVFQCWGDDPAGPDRSQCQFGGLAGDARAAQNVLSRQINNSLTLIDPAESIVRPAGSLTNVYVPFASITGENVTDPTTNSYFDAYSTNEVPLGRTRTDGGGEAFMELQTGEEAPGLGCGVKIAVAGQPKKLHPCWLVVVPRDTQEVDGTPVPLGGQLLSSPLSQSNWDQRIVFPLDFLPVELSCPLGAKERQTQGQESFAEAIGRWQSTLCQKTSAVYGFTQVTDDMARTQLESKDPGLVFVGDPAPATDFTGAAKPVYAPIALSGLAIGFNIQRQSSPSAPPEVRALDGQRITELNLNARLVAKLITQSYQGSVVGGQTYLAKNARALTSDPEFLDLNPSFKTGFYAGAVPDLLMPLSGSDAIAALWRWIAADPDAKAFMAGTADPNGMVVNKNYAGMTLAGRSDLPKTDVSCIDAADPLDPQLCETDFRPYANDMHDGARSASRGDDLSRASLDKTVIPPVYKKGALQPDGSRAVVALTDTATAARYGLVMARLRNASGAFVGPTPAGLLAGAKAMKASGTAGVRLSNPATKDPAAYPLTTLTYAATVPANLNAAERRDAAALIRYAVGAGQIPGVSPGTLPAGYVPLPASLRTPALAAGTAIAHYKPPVKKPTSNASGSTSAASSTPTIPAEPSVTPQPPDSPLPNPNGGTAAPVPTTAAVHLGQGSRDVVLDSVGLGVVGALAGPTLTRISRRRRW